MAEEEVIAKLASEAHAAGELASLTKDTPFKRAFGRIDCQVQLCSLLNAMLCNEDNSPLEVVEVLNVESKDTVLRSVIYVSAVRKFCSKAFAPRLQLTRCECMCRT